MRHLLSGRRLQQRLQAADRLVNEFLHSGWFKLLLLLAAAFLIAAGLSAAERSF